MATKTHVELIDDIDGSPAIETVQFSVRGVAYEMDLGEVSLKTFDDVFRVFVQHARKGPGVTRSHQRSGRRRSNDADSAAVRAWAMRSPSLSNRIKQRGRIPADIVQQWVDAGSPRPSFTQPSLS